MYIEVTQSCIDKYLGSSVNVIIWESHLSGVWTRMKNMLDTFKIIISSGKY